MSKIVEVTCNYCKGTGSYIIDGCDQRVPCKVCNQTGKMRVIADIAGNPLTCAFCSGKGGEPFQDKPCKVCGGCGWSGAMRDF